MRSGFGRCAPSGHGWLFIWLALPLIFLPGFALAESTPSTPTTAAAQRTASPQLTPGPQSATPPQALAAQVQAASIQATFALAAALIAALITGVVALINENLRRENDFTLRRLDTATQRQLANLKADVDRDLVAFKAKADETLAGVTASYQARLSAENARREYEYEALKRLYEECEPILFALSQCSRSAIGRIKSLAREARDGNLAASGGLLDDPLTADDYYFRSTLYLLLSPIALAYLLQTKLTAVDLRIDRYVRRQFYLSESLYKTYARHFDFAEKTPPVANYALDPSEGVHVGHIERAANALLVTNDGKTSLLTFGAFEQRFIAADGKVIPELLPFVSLFRHFHPGQRPVLWRVLIAQYYVLRALRVSVRATLNAGKPDPTRDELTLDVEAEADLLWEKNPSTCVQAMQKAALTAGHGYMIRALGRVSD